MAWEQRRSGTLFFYPNRKVGGRAGGWPAGWLPMAWEQRRSGTLFFYHNRKVGGRVVRDYHGCGPQAQLAADLIVEVRDRKAALVQALKNELEDWGSLGGMME